ncbi:MAG TPA: HEAT repeat domain-containing protein [Gemmatimonadales bacterium]|nr:HEAT repeat domain-containing protein [Gemmatimonadales bacterium]
MPVDTSKAERALGAIGTTFRLSRLYPATHPAVTEAMRQIAAELPGLSALGTAEWKIGATGLHWRGQQLLPRNSQVAELAGLLYARGVRAIHVDPGVTVEHVLSLFGVALGNQPPDDPTLGRITLVLGRRLSQRLSGTSHAPARASGSVPAPAAASAPPPAPEPAPPVDRAAVPGPLPEAAPAPGPAPEAPVAGDIAEPRRSSISLQLEKLPVEVEARRALSALREADHPDTQRAAAEKLVELAPGLRTLRDIGAIADVIAGLDRLMAHVTDETVLERIGDVASALSDAALVDRMVARVGEARVPPAEREALIHAVGALAALTTAGVLAAFLTAPPELREPYRAAIRVAADRAIETLQGKLADPEDQVVAAAAEFLGLTGAPAAVPLLTPLIRHRSATVREAVLHALAELGGREIQRPAIPALKDESVLVRIAAARAVGVGGDSGATTVLVRRLELEEDEGVLAELLKAIGSLAAREALDVLAKYADPGGRMKRRTAFIRAAAIDGLSHLKGPEARGLIELYAQDKDPAVRRAAEAARR